MDFKEIIKLNKIEAIKACYGQEHQCKTVITLIDDSIVTGWYYEEWGTTLEEFKKSFNINTDEDLLKIYEKWIEQLDLNEII